MRFFRFGPEFRPAWRLGIADIIILLALLGVLYVGVRMAISAPAIISGPKISLSFWALPWYTLLSVGRMFAAYILSLLFTLIYGYTAAHNRTAEKVLMPLLDVLQSVPILSFLPVVLLSLSSVLPAGLAAELAAIALIFTSQAWNMTYSFFQSIRTVPRELQEASAVFRLGPWLQFRKVELPFAAVGLIWNSIMSWAGGWFFLMASEIFTVGERDFRLPGIGAYLQTAASEGNANAIIAGIITLIATIVVLDRVVWRPILAWAEKFKVETVTGEKMPSSMVYDLLSRSWIFEKFIYRGVDPLLEWIDDRMARGRTRSLAYSSPSLRRSRYFCLWILGITLGLFSAWGAYRTVSMLILLETQDWLAIGLGTFATFLRVAASLFLALVWTVPTGVAIGTNRRLADLLQPIVQIAASVPATALFPVLLMGLAQKPGGMNIAAILLMLMGSQWYLLFNTIAGTTAIPQDLRHTTALLRLSRRERWKNLILPALFPYLVTGSITATGGAWNASIVAEHAQFGGHTHTTTGIGSLIAMATARGNYPLLLASTIALVLVVVAINRFFWSRLYRVAEERYRME